MLDNVVDPLRTRDDRVCTNRVRRLEWSAVAPAVRLTFAAEAVGMPDCITSSLDVRSLVRSLLVPDNWQPTVFTFPFGEAYAEARATKGVGTRRIAGRTVNQYRPVKLWWFTYLGR
jgi:hypothetical protein